MQVRVVSQNRSETKVEALLLFVFQTIRDKKKSFLISPTARSCLSSESQSLISTLERSGDFSAASGHVTLLYPQKENYQRLVLVGLGSRKKVEETHFLEAVGIVATLLQKKKLTHLSVIFPTEVVKDFGPERSGLLFMKGFQMAQYQFVHFMEKRNHLPVTKSITFLLSEQKQQEKFLRGVAEGEALTEAINETRFYGDLPAGDSTPSFLAKRAQRIAKEYPKVSCKLLGRSQMQKLKMGGILAVSRGSAQEPVFIILEYRGGLKKHKPVAFVGKGITFDSGGLNIKNAEAGIHEMKYDMSGGGAVVGIIQAAARMGLKKNIVGIVPSCENLLGSNAYKPGDIIRLMSGKTVEVVNTDAEGRIILADGLTYAKRFMPKAIVDLATLTGACRVALGNYYDGVFTRDEVLYRLVMESAASSVDKLWRLPLGDEYTKEVKSEVADLANIGKSGKFGASSHAAAFLEQFVLGERWVHLDIAPTAWNMQMRPWIRAGATGVGVHLGIEIAKRL